MQAAVAMAKELRIQQPKDQPEPGPLGSFMEKVDSAFDNMQMNFAQAQSAFETKVQGVRKVWMVAATS